MIGKAYERVVIASGIEFDGELMIAEVSGRLKLFQRLTSSSV